MTDPASLKKMQHVKKDAKFNPGRAHACRHIYILQKPTINLKTHTYMTSTQLYTSKNPQVYISALLFSTHKEQDEMRNLLFLYLHYICIVLEKNVILLKYF